MQIEFSDIGSMIFAVSVLKDNNYKIAFIQKYISARNILKYIEDNIIYKNIEDNKSSTNSLKCLKRIALFNSQKFDNLQKINAI